MPSKTDRGDGEDGVGEYQRDVGAGGEVVVALYGQLDSRDRLPAGIQRSCFIQPVLQGGNGRDAVGVEEEVSNRKGSLVDPFQKINLQT